MVNAQLNFLHICDYASISDGGKLNILGIFENIFAKTVLTTHPQFYIVTNIGIKQVGNYKLIIKIVRNRDGQEIITPLEFNLTIGQLPATNIANAGVIGQLNNVKFEEAGTYSVQIFIDAEKIGERSLVVTKIA